jgi:MoaA/NifB/PqqE/SkfB family radical SAM enzyme
MIKIRTDINANYKGIFFNGKTVRQRINPNLPITSPNTPEILDIAINDKCNAGCTYCYTDAKKTGNNFSNIISKAINLWGDLDQNEKPFQIAIGGAGESTLHPDWCEFVKCVHDLGIVPNYTTNGMHTNNKILEYTEKYCGGVAISYHPHIKKVFHKAINDYSNINTILNCHVILSDNNSLNDLKDIYNKYNNVIKYFVILPYQNAGRGKYIDCKQTWVDCFNWINTLDVNRQKQFAFGALFYNFMKENNIALDIDIYEPEIYSGYLLMDDSYNKIRNSSYDLTIKKTYDIYN